MADAVQTSIPSTEAAAPVAAAPAAAPAAEAKATETVDYAAQFKALEKTAAKLAKELEATKAKASEADDLKSRLAEVFGLGKKADPVEELTKLRDANTRLQNGVKRSAIMEAVRSAAKDAHDASDLLAFLDVSDVEVDIDSASVRNVEAVAERISALREKRPYLFQQAKPAAVGLPMAPPKADPPPASKTAPPRANPVLSGPGVFGRR